MAKNLKVCIIIDEASTISSQSVLIIYLKVEDCNAPPAIFLDLVELEAQDAETIYTTMLNSIYNVGFDIMLCRRRRKSINGSKRRPTIKYKICCLMILSTRRLAAFWLMPFIFRVSGMTPLSSRLNEIFGWIKRKKLKLTPCTDRQLWEPCGFYCRISEMACWNWSSSWAATISMSWAPQCRRSVWKFICPNLK